MESYRPVSDYLPHQAPMILIDRALFIDEQRCICQVTVNLQSAVAPFLDEQLALPNWFSLELMAQTIGVWNGYHAMFRNQQPQLGMLLGCRGFKSDLSVYPLESELTIHALLFLRDNNLANFDCHITLDKQIICQAKLNVYEPDQVTLNQLIGASPTKEEKR